MAYENEWETSSGFALDGATATVTAMEFGFNANMGAGITCANFTLTPDDGSDPIEQSFSVGKNFEASRDGSELLGAGKVNKRSNYGMLMESVKEVVDDPGSVVGNPREAEGWVGTTWVWGTVEAETTNPSTGVTKTTSKFIVTGYVPGEDAPAKQSAPKKSAKSTPKKPTKGGASDLDPEVWDEMVELAKQFDDHDDFLDAAFELDSVANDTKAQRAAMKVGPGGVWEAAKGTE